MRANEFVTPARSASLASSNTMYDALVVGLGAMGSSALYHLAARGIRAIGVDAFDPPHALGSTHGRSRIIREAYYEHTSYVPLVRRAYENWSALEQVSGEVLFRRTGGIMIGPRDCELVTGAMASATLHGIGVELLEARETRRRFPALEVGEDMVGLYETSAGILFPEVCVGAYLTLARRLDAEIMTNSRVTSLSMKDEVVTATTAAGQIRARRVIIAAGSWASPLLAMIGATSIPLEVERQTMHWFEPVRAELVTPDRLPILMIEHEPGRIFYGMPNLGDGVKAAIHHEGAIVAPDTVSREVTDADTAPVERLLRRFIPSAAGPRRESVVCLYTDTPDRDFVIDSVGNAVIVSACSGHGFKFASAIGEIAADMALGEQPSLDLSHFRATRFV